MLRALLGLLFIAHLYWKFALLPGGVQAWWSGLIQSGYPAVVLPTCCRPKSLER
jgi:putative oxidoreductase